MRKAYRGPQASELDEESVRRETIRAREQTRLLGNSLNPFEEGVLQSPEGLSSVLIHHSGWPVERGWKERQHRTSLFQNALQAEESTSGDWSLKRLAAG
jgi:hypothetical protein